MELYSPLRPDELFVLLTVGSCGDWIVAFALMLVGLIAVRAAAPKAGYLVGGGGLLLFLSECCSYAPNLVGQMGVYFDGEQLISGLGMAASLMTHLAGWGAIIAGAALLARAALAPPEPPEGVAP